MKLKRYLVQGFLLLLCSMSPVAGSSAMQQEPQQPQNPQKVQQKKPRIQTSASEKEVVFKPLTETGKKPEAASEKKVVSKGKGTGKKEVAPKKEVATTKKEKGNYPERYMALKSNIAYDAAGLPNLAFEMQFSKDYIGSVPKYDGFCTVPEHIGYRSVVGKFLNLYEPIDHRPQEGDLSHIQSLVRHIFGEQYELGMDYLQLLYLQPIQKLPILLLVSEERNTGKST